MSIFFYLILAAAFILILQDKKEWVEVYSTFESNLSEAQCIFFCLKAHGIPCSYRIIPHKRNWFYKLDAMHESTISIKVTKNYEQLAKDNLFDYRILSRQKTRSFY